MGNLKKTINVGDMTITVEVKDNTPCVAPTPWGYPTPNRVSVCSAPNRVAPIAPNREPDGFDAHIDRPVRSNYGGVAWAAEDAFQRDLAKYRKAESAVKACTWPTREPIGNTPCWPVPQQPTQTEFVPVRQPQPRDAWGRFAPTCGCGRKAKAVKRVAQRCGIVPVGAKVVAHTWDGQPIFDC